MALAKPTQITVPFSSNGVKNTIPETATGSNLASMQEGFPVITMTDVDQGGMPPQGQDMNGILFDVTKAIQYQQAGGLFPYDATFAQAIDGYPLGALLTSADGSCLYQNTVSGNVSDPDNGGQGWSQILSSASIAGKQDKLTPVQMDAVDSGITSARVAIYDSYAAGKQDTLTFDNTPTNGSSNPVTSDGIYAALGTKQDTITVDAVPTSGSANPVQSGGVYDALAEKVDISGGNSSATVATATGSTTTRTLAEWMKDVSESVRFTPQELTVAQKAQARSNIGADSSSANAETWAEGSDADVAQLGGVHSAKGWAEIAGNTAVELINDAVFKNIADDAGFELGTFDANGNEIASTTAVRSAVLTLNAGDEVSIITNTAMTDVVIYTSAGLEDSNYTALRSTNSAGTQKPANGNGWWMKADGSLRIGITFSSAVVASQFVASPSTYLMIQPRVVVDVGEPLTFEKRVTNGTTVYNHATTIISKQFIRFRRGDRLSTMPHNMTVVGGLKYNMANQAFSNVYGAATTNIVDVQPYIFSDDVICRLRFGFGAQTDRDSAYPYIENDFALYKNIPACIQPASLTNAPVLNQSEDKVAHVVSLCHVGDGECYAVYYANKEGTVESYQDPDTQIILAKFNITKKEEITYKVAVSAGDVLGSVTLDTTHAPYDPQIIKVSDTELRIYFLAFTNDNNIKIGYITYNPQTDTFNKSFVPLTVSYNGTSYQYDKTGFQAMYSEAGINISTPTYLSCNCKFIYENGYYYCVFYSVRSGDRGVLVKSTDLTNWEVVSFIESSIFTTNAETALAYENGVFYAIIRGDDGMFFCAYDGQSWTSDRIDNVRSKPLFMKSWNGKILAFVTVSSRRSFHILSLESSKLKLLCTAYAPTFAHYFDFMRIGEAFYLGYSSDTKLSSSPGDRGTIQLLTIDTDLYTIHR